VSGSSPQRLWTPGPWICGETALTVDIPNRVQEHCQTNSKSFRIVGTFKAVASHTPDAIDSSVSREYRPAQPPIDPVQFAGPPFCFRASALMYYVASLPPGRSTKSHSTMRRSSKRPRRPDRRKSTRLRCVTQSRCFRWRISALGLRDPAPNLGARLSPPAHMCLRIAQCHLRRDRRRIALRLIRAGSCPGSSGGA
jgi:hypothetical protein